MRGTPSEFRTVQQRHKWAAHNTTAPGDGLIDIVKLGSQVFFLINRGDPCHIFLLPSYESFCLSQRVTIRCTSSLGCPGLRPIWPASAMIRASFGLPCSSSK